MDIMSILHILALTLVGGVLSRLHGRGALPKVWASIMWAIIPSLFVLFAYFEEAKFFESATPETKFYTSLSVALIGGALCSLGKATGHGQYFSLGTVIKSIKPERLDFIVRWFFKRDPRVIDLSTVRHPLAATIGRIQNYGDRKLYWRCVFGLAVTGLASVSGYVLTVCWINPAAAAFVALGGAAKSIAYMIGHKVYPAKATEIGEWLSGAIVYTALGIATLC